MKYKMIVLDLDGTLTNDKKEITPKTREALMAAQDRGVRVVLASGRPTYGITALAEELNLAAYGGFFFVFFFGGFLCLSGGAVGVVVPIAPRDCSDFFSAAPG